MSEVPLHDGGIGAVKQSASLFREFIHYKTSMITD